MPTITVYPLPPAPTQGLTMTTFPVVADQFFSALSFMVSNVNSFLDFAIDPGTPLTALPALPAKANFSAGADAFVASLSVLVTEVNALIADMDLVCSPVTALPAAPNRASPVDYQARAVAFVAALSTLQAELNAFIEALNTYDPYAVPTVTGAPQLVSEADGGATGTSSFSVAYPATGIAANHVAFIHIWITGSTAVPTVDTPSGWNVVQNDAPSAAQSRHVVFWRRLSGSESGSVAITVSAGVSSGSTRYAMTIWNGCVETGTPYEGVGSVDNGAVVPFFGTNTRATSGPDRTLVHFYGFYLNAEPTLTVSSDYSLSYKVTAVSRSMAMTYKYLTVPKKVAELSSSTGSGFCSIYLSLIPKTPVSSTTPYAADSFWPQVKLLCGFDGTNGSTTFVDESSAARTLTANGNAQLSTTAPKYGSASALFDGSGDFVSAADSGDWDFSARPFTIEGFVKFAGKNDSQAIIGQWDNGGSSTNCAFYLFIVSGALTMRIGSGGSLFDCGYAWAPTLGTWYHVAYDRDASGKARLYIDGAMVASSTTQNVGINNSNNSLVVGRIGTGTTFASFDFQGNQDELRITSGVARYNSDSGFTVPAAAYPRS